MGIGSALQVGFSLNYQLSRRGECGLLAGQDRCCDSQEQHLPYDYSLQSAWARIGLPLIFLPLSNEPARRAN